MLLPALLCALLTPPQEALPEVAPGWTAEAELPAPGTEFGTVSSATRGNRFAVTRKSLLGPLTESVPYETVMYDELGNEIWRQPEPLGDPDKGLRIVDSVAFSADGDLVLVLVNQQSFYSSSIEVRARDAADGALVWTVVEPIGGGVVEASLVNAGGRSLLCAYDVGPGTLDPSRIVVLDDAAGEIVFRIEDTLRDYEAAALSPSAGLALIRDTSAGALRALDWTTGALQWVGVGSVGVGAVELLPGAGVVAAGDGPQVLGIDLDSGSLAWTSGAPSATLPAALVSTGDGLLTVANVGSGSNVSTRLRMLDSVDGSERWSLDLPGSDEDRLSAAADAVGARVAVCSDDLRRAWIIDASVGTLISETPLSSSPTGVEALEVDGAWGWLTAYLDPSGQLAEILAAGGELLGGVPAVAFGDASTSTGEWLWFGRPEGGGLIHAVWDLTIYEAGTPPEFGYEVRDAATGVLVGGWDSLYCLLSPDQIALSGDGSRVAILERGPFTCGPSWLLRVREPLSGAVLLERELNEPDFPAWGRARLGWSADETRLLVAYDAGSFYEPKTRVRCFDALDLTLLWEQTMPSPSTGQTIVDAFEVAAGPERLGLVVSHYPQEPSSGTIDDGISNSYVIDVTGGAILAESTLDLDDDPQADVDIVPIEMLYVPGANQFALTTRVYVTDDVTGVETSSARVLVLDGTTGELVTSVDLTSPEQADIYSRGGAVLSADGSRLLVGGLVDSAEPVRLTALETAGWTEVWRRSVAPDPLGEFGVLRQARLAAQAGARIVVVEVEQEDAPQSSVNEAVVQSLLAFDSEEGRSLWEARASGLGPEYNGNNMKRPRVLAGSGSVWMAGWLDKTEAGMRPVLRRMDTAALLDGGEAVSLSAAEPVPLVVDRGALAAGRAYLVLGSATGSGPATPLEKVAVPLALDGYTLQTIAGANGPVFQGTLGLLDDFGSARSALAVPAGLSPSLVGRTLFHAVIDFEPGASIDGVTNATSFMFVP